MAKKIQSKLVRRKFFYWKKRCDICDIDICKKHLKGERIFGMLDEEELRTANRAKLKILKDEFYIYLRCHDNMLKSWNDQKRHYNIKCFIIQN